MVFSEYLNSFYSVAGQAANLTMKMGHKILSSTGVIQNSTPEVKLPPSLQNLEVSKLVTSGSIIVRIAAISGATAVLLGAYGAHKILALAEKENFEERVTLFETANRYHFYHSLALLCSPLCKYPRTAAAFMAAGIILFSGACYYHALTGNKTTRILAPTGAILLVLGWISMVV